MGQEKEWEVLKTFVHGDYRYEVVMNTKSRSLGLISFYIDPTVCEEEGVDVDVMKLEELGEVAGVIFGIYCE